MKYKGIVVRGHGKSFVVRSEGRDIACEIRGKIKHTTSGTTPVAVGDDVLISLSSQTTGMIEEVGERQSMLFRPAKGSDRRQQVIAANLDQLAVVVSVKSPELKPGLIDRFLIAAEIGGLSPLIIINKIDLGQAEILAELKQGYTDLGIPVFFISALKGEGLDTLDITLRGHKTIFAGHSGVGKSTILNHFLPGINLRVGDVSDYSNKGVHTTSGVQLFELPHGGFVVDTPGLKILGLWEVSREELADFFPEFAPYIDQCRFTGCSHLHEPDCAVKEAVTRGDIPRFRYNSYAAIHKSL